MDEQIVDKLKAMADTDPSADVRSAASETLETLAAPPVEPEGPGVAAAPEPIPPATKRRQFLIGFVGWYLAYGLLWLILARGYPRPQFIATDLGCLPFLINIGLLVGFGLARKVRWIALGILTALAVNFLVSLALGVLANGICFVPFFIK